ncbi:MAG TPA: histidine kinase [Puia sp.]|nr:histidine kinase [Puia sp.]
MSIFEQILFYQKKNRLVSHLLFWLVVLLISVVSAKYYDGNEFTLSWAFMGSGLYLINQVVATYFLTYFIIPQFFFSKRYGLALISFIIGSYVICVLARFNMVRIAEPLSGQAPKASETNINILTDLPKLIFVYFFRIFSLAFFFLFIKLLKDQFEIQRRALTLEKEKAETELKLLKAQLNPHFLFNTLNNIYSLSLAGSPATSASIGRLAEILDHILYRCNNLLVPLSGELTLLNNYICLEKLRYDERLKVNFRIGGQEEIGIAPLILLTIVENAFKHGVSQDIGDVRIDIGLDHDGGQLRFRVSNTYKPMPGEGSSGNIGLPNLRQQLELIYPKKHVLSITRTETLFTVDLHIDVT